MPRKSTKTESETLKKEDVIQAVVIVDSFKGGFHPVTNTIPTALIPIINAPLLDYTLECLSLSVVQEVIIFCSSHADLIKEHVKQSKWNNESSAMSLSVIVSESCRSMGDVMRDLDAKAVIRSDFILISADMVGNINLLPILQQHREILKKDKGAVMTMVYKEAGPGHRTRTLEDEAIFAVDTFSNRLLAHLKLNPKSKRKLEIPLETYVDRSQVELLYNLLDTRVAICSPAVPPLFSDNFDFQTRDDFVRGLLMNEEILASTLYMYVLEGSQYAAHVTNWQMYQAVSKDIIHRWVYPFVPDTPFSWQEPYMFLRRCVYKQKSVCLGIGSVLEEDVVVAENTTIGENTFISNSVIGKNCKIGNKVKIWNSFIWDDVVIGDNCSISHSLIANQSKLGKGVTLDKGVVKNHVKGCIMCSGVELPTNKKIEANILVSSPKEAECDSDQDEEYKVQKITEKAYSLQIIRSDSDDEDDELFNRVYGYWVDGNASESESESEDELSEVSDKSECSSPVPEDTHLFFTEVMDSLTRGYDDKLLPENLILEINSSRYAYNVSVREVNYFVVKAILSLPIQARSADSSVKYLTEFNKLLREFLPILQNYMRNSDAQQDCLQALEDMATSKDFLRDVLSKLLHLLYDKDVLSEDTILEWHKSADEESETATVIRRQVEPFIRWLEEADEESEESD